MAGKPRRFIRPFALVDPLFRGAPPIVQGNHAFGRAGFSEAPTGLPGPPIQPDARNRPYRALARWRLDPTTLCHRLLGHFPAGPLVPAETRLRIDEAYREDWAFVVDYIKAHRDELDEDALRRAIFPSYLD